MSSSTMRARRRFGAAIHGDSKARRSTRFDGDDAARRRTQRGHRNDAGPMRLAARIGHPMLRWGHDRVVDATVDGFRRHVSEAPILEDSAPTSASASATIAHERAHERVSSGWSSADAGPGVAPHASSQDDRAVDPRGDCRRRDASRSAQRPLRKENPTAASAATSRRQSPGLRPAEVPDEQRERPHATANPRSVCIRRRRARGCSPSTRNGPIDDEQESVPGRPVATPTIPERARHQQATGGQRDEPRVRDGGVQRMAVQLVERVGRDADGEEEGEQSPSGGRVSIVRREARADDHVREVPGCIRRVKQGPPVAPAARTRRIEGGPFHFRRSALQPTSQARRRGSSSEQRCSRVLPPAMLGRSRRTE